MEKGARVLILIMLMASMLGGLVIATVPAYRTTLLCIIRGQSEQSPIWQSNAHYYEEVRISRAGDDHDPE